MLKISLWLLFLCLTSVLLGQDTLTGKVKELVEMSNRSPVIQLTGDSYKAYLKNQPRNYSMIVMLTAMDSRRGCRICSMATDEFTIVANSLRYDNPKENRVFFAMADYDRLQAIFNEFNVNSAPVFMHFPAKRSPTDRDTLDIQRFGFSAETIAKWVQTQTTVNVRVLRPPNYTGTILLALFMCLGTSLLYFKRNSLEFLFTRSMWQFFSMSAIFYMISGQVWNHIRGPPLIQANQKYEMIFIYPGSDYQFVAETMIVMCLYIAISGSFILMHEIGNCYDPTKRRMCSFGGLILFVLAVSFLLSIFRRKYQGYPYTFLFK